MHKGTPAYRHIDEQTDKILNDSSGKISPIERIQVAGAGEAGKVKYVHKVR